MSIGCTISISRVRTALSFILGLLGILLAVTSLTAHSSSNNRQTSQVELPSALPLATPISINAPGWSLITSPKVAGPQYLQGTTCVSNTDCWVVGYYITYGNHYQTLIEHWDGSAWKIVGSANQGSEFNDNVLDSVTCLTSVDCWAVGYAGSSTAATLVEHWDGLSWAVVNSPTLGSSTYLNAVTCLSTSDCWSVGQSYTGQFGRAQTLAEHWDGTSWAIVSSPNQGTQSSSLTAVACSSPSECWAVGYIGSGDFSSTPSLIEKWTGTSWTIVSSPNPTGFQNPLFGITCSSVTQCWAVGYSKANSFAPDQSFVAQWNGMSWSTVSSPNQNGTGNLRAVSCTQASNCWAVGHSGNSGNASKALVERWDGVSWSVISSLSPAPNQNAGKNNLLSVACSSDSNCFAAGFYTASPDQTLIEQWEGASWVISDSPNRPTALPELRSVACTSAVDCWAVGRHFINGVSGAPTYAVTEHWDGTRWKVIKSVNGDVNQDELRGVACNSSSDCWAVGYAGSGTFTEKWDGISWTRISSPNQGNEDNRLYGIACVSPSDCWSVGSYLISPTGGSSYLQTLTEHWDGSSWTIVSSPNQGSNANNRLLGVACTSGSDCWAVGSGSPGTLIEHWDGNSWTLAGSPSTGTLAGVTCSSPSQCWAVGTVGTQSLILRWDGIAWGAVASPSLNTDEMEINGVTCTSATTCWLVGWYDDNNALFARTLVEQWNGTSWTVVSSPNLSTDFNDFNFLYGIACLPASQCWAVGFGRSSMESPLNGSLIEEYSFTVPAVTSATSQKTHGASGDFGISLPFTGAPGIESRNSGSGYNVVFTFPNEVTNCGSAGTPGGSVIAGPGSNQCTENLVGVSNAQYTNVALNDVIDSENNAGNVSVSMGVLVGDTNGSGAVTSGDVSLTKSRIGQPIDATNFRTDINANGVINASDTGIVKFSLGSGLP